MGPCVFACVSAVSVQKKELRVNRPVLPYVAYAAAVSLLHRSEFGVNSLLLNYIFGLYLVVLCANFGADLSKDDWLDIVSGAASILMIVILIKNLIYYQGFLDYLRAEGMAHPWGVKMIIGGGSNIESSWLGLLAFFFLLPEPLEVAVCRREPDAFVPVWEPRGNADRRCGDPLAFCCRSSSG